MFKITRMEYTNVVSQIINLVQKIEKTNARRVKDAIEMKGALEFSGAMFKETFIPDYYDEIMFSALTGLSVSADSIKYYVAFKKKLGKNYTWKSIGHIKHYLTLDDDNVVRVVISKSEIAEKKFKTIVGISFFILGIMLIVVMLLLQIRDLKQGTAFILLFSILLLFGVGILNSLSPINTAIGIDKRIKTVNL